MSALTEDERATLLVAHPWTQAQRAVLLDLMNHFPEPVAREALITAFYAGDVPPRFAGRNIGHVFSAIRTRVRPLGFTVEVSRGESPARLARAAQVDRRRW